MPPVAAFMFTRKGRRGKRGTIRSERGKIFEMKEENENISFNLQVLVLVKTEMKILLCTYYKPAHPV